MALQIKTHEDSGNQPILDKASGQLRLPKEVFTGALWFCHIENLKTEVEKSKVEVMQPGPEVINRLSESRILVDGKLERTANQLLTIINKASLEVQIDIQIGSQISSSFIWATSSRAVRANSLDGINIDLQPIAAERVPQTITDFIVIARSDTDGESPIAISYEIIKAVKRLGKARTLEAFQSGGLDETSAQTLTEFLGNNSRKWKITSTWSTENANESSSIQGIDAGEKGHWLIGHTGTDENPGQMNYTPLTQSDITKSLRSVMPKMWSTKPVRDGLLDLKHLGL